MSGINKLTHAKFYALCEWVKGEAVLDSPTTLVELAKAAEARLGFPVIASTVGDALTATGKSYMPKSSRVYKQELAGSEVKVLAQAMCRLYDRLGECAPSEVQELAKK